MINKKGFEFSFGWLFAIIVGAAVLFLAIYASTKIIGTGQKITNTEAGQSMGAILSPFKTTSEDSNLASPIDTGVPTRIYFNCTSDPLEGNTARTFGKQTIEVSVSSGTKENWPAPGIANTYYDKYIFSTKIVEDTRKLYLLTLPFKYPFKIADIQIIFSDKQKYCFIDSPQTVKDTLNSTPIPVLQFVSNKNDCKAGATKVCFTTSGAGCDISVNLQSNSVQKNRTTLYYESSEYQTGDSLLYGAMFADPQIYECQVKRLSKRLTELARIYQEKNDIVSGAACSSNLGSELSSLATESKSLVSSLNLRSLGIIAKEVENKNENQNCKLY